MKHFFALIVALAATGTASASPCYLGQAVDGEITADDRTVFFGPCGFYEIGYRLDEDTLYFPRGGQHRISGVSVEEAQRILRDAYGLVGTDNTALVRTENIVN